MTEREKLIKLIGKARTSLWGKSVPDMPTEDSMIADYLLANGVTVPKTGRWIIHSNGRGKDATNWAECSECHVCGSPHWKVCPVCETKMEDC